MSRWRSSTRCTRSSASRITHPHRCSSTWSRPDISAGRPDEGSTTIRSKPLPPDLRLDTERLTLRLLVEADWDEYLVAHRDPDVMRFVGNDTSPEFIRR